MGVCLVPYFQTHTNLSETTKLQTTNRWAGTWYSTHRNFMALGPVFFTSLKWLRSCWGFHVCNCWLQSWKERGLFGILCTFIVVGYEQDSRHGLWWLWCSPICGILSHSTTPYNHQPTEPRVLQPLLLFHVEHERWQDQGHSHWPAEPAESGSWWVMGPISPFCWSNSACATWEAMVQCCATVPLHRNTATRILWAKNGVPRRVTKPRHTCLETWQKWCPHCSAFFTERLQDTSHVSLK
jgi:hypothetical protein